MPRLPRSSPHYGEQEDDAQLRTELPRIAAWVQRWEQEEDRLARLGFSSPLRVEGYPRSPFFQNPGAAESNS